MRSLRFTSLSLTLAACLVSVSGSIQARHGHTALHGLANVNSLFLVINGPDRKAINRENTSDLCLVALMHALQEERISVATSRAKADAELVFTGSYVTITEGSSSNIGKAKLSYAVAIKDANGTLLWSMVDDAAEDSIADACMAAAEDIAEELESARDDARD